MLFRWLKFWPLYHLERLICGKILELRQLEEAPIVQGLLYAERLLHDLLS